MCACVCVCVRYDVLRCDKAYAQACTDEHVCVCECVLTPLRRAVPSVHHNMCVCECVLTPLRESVPSVHHNMCVSVY